MFPSGNMGGLALPLGVAITIVVDPVGSRYLGSGADAGSDAGAAYIVASSTESFGDGDTGRLWLTGADHRTSGHF